MTSIYQKLITAGFSDSEIRAEVERGEQYAARNGQTAAIGLVNQDDSDPIITIRISEGMNWHSTPFPSALMFAFDDDGNLREDGHAKFTFITDEYPGFVVRRNPAADCSSRWEDAFAQLENRHIPQFLNLTNSDGAYFTRVEDPSTFTVAALSKRWTYANHNVRLWNYQDAIRPANKAEYVESEKRAAARQTEWQEKNRVSSSHPFAEVGFSHEMFVLRADAFASPILHIILHALKESVKTKNVTLRNGDAHFASGIHLYQTSDVTTASLAAWGSYADTLEEAHAHFLPLVRQLKEQGVDVHYGPHVDARYSVVGGEFTGFWSLARYPIPGTTQRVSVHGHYTAKDFLPGGAVDQAAAKSVNAA